MGSFGLKICGLVFLLLLSLFMVIGGIVILQGQNVTSDGCGLEDPIFFGHKGYTVQYQENTLLATTDAIANGLNTEFDIQQISDEEIISFHDDNADTLTGTDLDVSEAKWEEIQQLQYLDTIQGYSYNQRLGVPTFQQIVQAACGADPNVDLDIDIKGELTEAYTQKIMEILDNSVCSCGENQNIVLSTPYWYQLSTLKDAVKGASRCNKALTSVWVHPDTYPLAEHFFIKTRMPAAFGNPDIMSFHKLIWQEHTDLIDGYTADGWCTAIYGDFREELEKYDASGYYVVDTADNNKEVTYSPNTGIYIGFMVLFVFGFVLLLVSIVLLVKTIRDHKKEQKAEYSVQPLGSDTTRK